jgi:zinc/manganese transport system substrate-binding protein
MCWLPAPAKADALKVITSTSDLAWAVREIGGSHVDVTSLLRGTENPHYVDAVPEFIRLAAEAKAAFVIGLDLEIGWMPKVLARSGNAQVQPGGKGYAEVGKAIKIMEKPTGPVDRSMGDVHPSGNPHFWLSPDRFAEAATPIADTLSSLDPAHAADYAAGLKKFQAKMASIRQREAAKLAPLRGKLKAPELLEYHKEFTYFLDTYALKSLGSIEEKPGVAPSAGRLAEVAGNAKAAGVKVVLAADTAPKKTMEQFKELSQLPVVIVPLSVTEKISDYEKLQDLIMDQVVKSLQAPTQTAKAATKGES